jgi:hypothetical protein
MHSDQIEHWTVSQNAPFVAKHMHNPARHGQTSDGETRGPLRRSVHDCDRLQASTIVCTNSCEGTFHPSSHFNRIKN